MDWTKIGKNMAALAAAETTILSVVPPKYQPLAHAILLVLANVAGLLQEIPTKKEQK